MRTSARTIIRLVVVAAALALFGAAPAHAGGAPIDVSIVTILVDFDNVQMSHPDEYWQERIFGASEGSVRDYYDEATYGKYRITPASETGGVRDDGVVHVTLGELHPGGVAGLAYPGTVIPVAQRAVQAADDCIDFSAFDADGDGFVLSHELQIALVFAGYEGSDSRAGRPAIWAHAGYYMLRSLTLDDVTLTDYFAQGELLSAAGDPLGIGTFCHELGHTLGLDDLYDTSGKSIGLGASSLMASGADLLDGHSPAHFDPYSLIKLGAIEPDVVADDAVVELHASDTPAYNIVKVPITEDGRQYFLLENRSTNGYDRGLREDPWRGGAVSGVAIYHVDDWVMDTWVQAVYGESRNANSNYLRKGVDLEEADGPALDQGWGEPHGGDHYFYDGHATEFGPDTYPDTGAYMDTLETGCTLPTGVRIRVSGESGDEVMRATITFEPDFAPAPDFPAGLGTPTRPYHITNAAELDKVRRYPQAHFVLRNDITFTAADFAVGGAFWNRGAGFRPLFGTAKFQGSLDGAGHTISGLYMNVAADGDVVAGLFGNLSGTVKDLSLVDCDVTATSTRGVGFAGGVAGKMVCATVKDCFVSGAVKADYAGGVFGSGGASIVSGCRNTATVSSVSGDGGGCAGGIAGQASMTSRLSRCGNLGSVSASSHLVAGSGPTEVNAGGVVGRLNATSSASQCFNAGQVTATAKPGVAGAWGGGVVSRSDFGGEITDCYNAGRVVSTDGACIGGIAGHTGGDAFRRCYNVGALQCGTWDWHGGIAAGAMEEGAHRIERCYYETTTDPGVPAIGFGIDPGLLTPEQVKGGSLGEMATQEHFEGFDFAKVWIMAGESGCSYPQLRAQRQALEQPGIPALTATPAGYDSVKVTWNEAAGATAYELSRATAAGGPYAVIARGAATALTDAGLATGTRYFYTVRAVASEGGLTVQGPDSEPVSATPTLAKAASPTLKKASATSIKASWKAVPGATGYELCRAKGAKGKFALVKTTKALTFTDTRLARKTAYRYKVRAYRLVDGAKVYGACSAVVKRAL